MFLLRIIFLSLIWGICSTCLVRPWFWKGVKNKYLFNDGVRVGFDNNSWKIDLKIEIAVFGITFCVSMGSYGIVGARQNIYGSFAMIILCFLSQLLWDYQKKSLIVTMLTIVVISAVLWMQDGIVGKNIKEQLNKVYSVPIATTDVDENTNIKLFVSSDEIKSLFKSNSASGPTYNNGKYIFTVSGGANGKGIVIIDKNNYTEANFVPCLYKLKVRDLRSKYPTQKLKELYITVSDDNVPYGLFAVADKSWFFGTYKVNSYIMYNLISGETQQFTREELPKFVTEK